MKRMVLTSLMILLISVVSFARKLIAEGKSHTTMGNFKIETADMPLVINGKSLDTYVITYESTNMSVTVAIEDDKKCRRYLTVSDRLSIQYVCTGAYFGVEMLDKKYAADGLRTSDAALNRSAYFHQKLLIPGKEDQVYCMKLIGAYFPELINDLEDYTTSR